jgi:predicted nucleic acid-binding protein
MSNPDGKLFFLDTNVFIYSFDRSAPEKSRRATQLIKKALTTGKGVVSYQVVQEFFNVALRRFAQPMSAEEAEQYLKTVFLPLLRIHSSQVLYLDALDLATRHRIPWYDSLIVASALQAQCALLLSEDFQHGRKFADLQIANPFA